MPSHNLCANSRSNIYLAPPTISIIWVVSGSSWCVSCSTFSPCSNGCFWSDCMIRLILNYYMDIKPDYSSVCHERCIFLGLDVSWIIKQPYVFSRTYSCGHQQNGEFERCSRHDGKDTRCSTSAGVGDLGSLLQILLEIGLSHKLRTGRICRVSGAITLEEAFNGCWTVLLRWNEWITKYLIWPTWLTRSYGCYLNTWRYLHATCIQPVILTC